MNTFKLTLSKLLFSCLAILFSVSFFSFKSHAYYNVSDYLDPVVIGQDIYGNDITFSFYNTDPNLRFAFLTGSNFSGYRMYIWNPDFSSNNRADYQYVLTVNNNIQYGAVTIQENTVIDGVSYKLNYGRWAPSFIMPFTSYSSTKDMINSSYDKIGGEPEPEYAIFGLKGFDYVAYTNEGMFTNRNFNLDYKVSWDGSTNPDYPITRVDYEIYGFSDRTFSNYDKSNGELLNSGEAFDGMSLNVDVLIKDFIGLPNVEKVVVYFIPFSGRTEGNTEFIVCNFYEPYLEFGFRGLGVNIGHLLGMNSLSYGSGNIPVPYTDTVTNGVDSAPVAIVDNIPVLTIDQTISGSFNTYNDYYYSHTTYAPVIYGDTTEINNYYDDHSSVITNNNNYTTIINNFNGSVDVDPESDAYANSIISFLTNLITFFSTFWSICIVALGWLPGWVQVFVGAIFGLLGTLVIGLGILRLMKGVL